MNRPYTIVHKHTSIDGNIDVMDLPEFEAGSRLYQDLALTPDRQVLNVYSRLATPLTRPRSMARWHPKHYRDALPQIPRAVG